MSAYMSECYREAIACCKEHDDVENFKAGALWAIAAGLFSISESLETLSHQTKKLGLNDASTNMGALEAVGAAIHAVADAITDKDLTKGE
jgi:hypothetical protein